MSLLSAIVEYFDTSNHNEAAALRVLLGDKLLADVLPPGTARPYCVLAEVRTENTDTARHSNRNAFVRSVVVSFAVFGANRAQVESVLEAIENAYMSHNANLTISGRTHLATTFSNRQSNWDMQSGWMGNIELNFKLTKQGV